MTDTQADLTERARDLGDGITLEFIDKWIREDLSRGGYGLAGQIVQALRKLIAEQSAALQSEREAAAAEARRAAIEECVTEVIAWRIEDGRDTGALKARLRLLASPPAPQEETR